MSDPRPIEWHRASLLACGAAFAAALAGLPGTSNAAWLAGGDPVSVTAQDVFDLTAVPDGSGGVYLAWTEGRSPGASVVAARVLADGSFAPGWPVNGLTVSGGRVGLIGAADDGIGGLFVFWDNALDIVPHLHSLNGDGTARPGYEGGFATTLFGVGGPAGHFARFAGDGAGGYYELHNFGNTTTFTDNLALARLTAANSLYTGWPPSGAIGASPNNQPYTLIGLATDPAGGALTGEIVPVADGNGTSQVGHVRRTLGDGSLGFSDSLVPNGHNGTPTGHAAIQSMSMVPDGSGGAFAAWRIGGSLGPALFMQHFLANGTSSWPTPTPAPVSDAMFRDGSGGAYLLGSSLSAARLELHRRAGDASTPTGWAGGHVLSTAAPFSSFAGVRSGSHVYACWSSGGGAADDVFGSAFSSDGSLPSGWTPGGNGICNVTGQQTGVVMVAGTADDAYVAWIDRRSGTSSDIYVARLMPSGPLVTAVPPSGIPLAFAAGPVRPNPADDVADFALTLPDASPATVEIADLQGRVVARAEPTQRSGPQRVTLPTSQLKNGLYFVRVRHAGHESSQRLSVFH